MNALKVLNDRVATKEDADLGTVVFHIPDQRSTPYDLGHPLPLLAKVVKPDDNDGFPPPGTIVNIVQAELGDNAEVVLGLMWGDGEEGLCMLQDIEVIGPSERV